LVATAAAPAARMSTDRAAVPVIVKYAPAQRAASERAATAEGRQPCAAVAGSPDQSVGS
jgi:hypothetical protein